MDSVLNKALIGVYNSSQEIIKNKQRHLYCNMLELLGRTTKTTGKKCANIDEFVLFWVTDILPLVFDEDNAIQRSAITAMEIATSILTFKTLHVSDNWAELRKKIVEDYSKKVRVYQETANGCWHRVWGILMRIIYKDIAKGSSTINTFLSIVESAFRNSNYDIRVESFYCWKILIELFANNDEICSQKRIRLICIPLRSSHPKTPQLATAKLQVWWYFITKQGRNIEQLIDTVFEPFLKSCSEPHNRNNAVTDEIREMRILCITNLLGNPSKLMKKKLEGYDLEIISETLVNNSIMEQMWKTIIKTAVDVMKDYSTVPNASHDMLATLTRYLFVSVIAIEQLDALKYLFEMVGTGGGRESIMEYLSNFVIGYTADNCFTTIQDPEYLGKFLSMICKHLITRDEKGLTAAEKLLKCPGLLNYDSFITVTDTFLGDALLYVDFSLWEILSKSLCESATANYSSLDSNLTLFIQWILWPLEDALIEDGPIYTDDVVTIYLLTLENLHNPQQKIQLLWEMAKLLNQLYKKMPDNSDLQKYFECYAKMFTCSSSHLRPDEEFIQFTFNILKVNLSADFNKSTFDCNMKGLRDVVAMLGESGIDKHFEDIKTVWSKVINHKRKNYVDDVQFDDLRKRFLDEAKKVASKSQYNKIKNYLENDDLFVIIPSVWSLNPEKLTERQKEKFLQKSDIPALYNDMSQSQDAFIKPWTPKKLVIAKGNVEEIVIGDRDGDVGSILDLTKPHDDEPSDYKNDSPQCSSLTRNQTKAVLNNENPSATTVNSKTTSFEHCLKVQSEAEAMESEVVIPETVDVTDDQMESDEIMLKDSLSPPDRNSTNNSTSPLPKTKASLLGRGAQLINLIKNRKALHFAPKTQVETSAPVSGAEQQCEGIEVLDWTNEQAEAKANPMNLLVFSKVLPSPCASPSAGILKRKRITESLEEVFENQAFKRKRVSFHDPPVSVTREYLRDEDNKNTPKRRLQMDPENSEISKNILKRSPNVDFRTPQQDDTGFELSATPTKRHEPNVMIYGSDTHVIENVKTVPKNPTFPLLFKTEGDVMNYVVNQYSIEDICDKYLTGENATDSRNNLVKLISCHINVEPEFKNVLFGMLAERNPSDFLDYAVQENSAAEVCDRLNLPALVNFTTSKMQTNAQCRRIVLQEIQNILGEDKCSSERWELLQKLISTSNLSDQQILDLIELLFESKRKHQSAVSVSAIDSSSTL